MQDAIELFTMNNMSIIAKKLYICSEKLSKVKRNNQRLLMYLMSKTVRNAEKGKEKPQNI